MSRYTAGSALGLRARLSRIQVPWQKERTAGRRGHRIHCRRQRL